MPETKHDVSVSTFQEVAEASTKYFNGDHTAGDTFAHKYALRKLPEEWVERTPDDMHQRLAKEFARIEAKYPNPLSVETIYGYLKNFKYIVPQGSPMSAIGNPYTIMSASNCMVVDSPKDSMSGIMETAEEMAQLMKRRAGVGVDLSELRPANTPVNNAAVISNGAYSFADFYSYVGRMIGQKGRNGAEMVTMDVRHPDSAMFATMKNDLTKVTGANISLRLSDDFMRAVTQKGTFQLQWPVEGAPKIARSILAEDLFNTITESAHKTGEPGLLMWDNYTKNLPAHCYEEFKTICTNPCAEIGLSAYDSCRLISLNLTHLVKNVFTDTAAFDFTKFKEVVRVGMRLCDDLVDLELEILDKIIAATTFGSLEQKLWKNVYRACARGRRTGLGTHGLADCLARLQLRYDSDGALQATDKIFATLRDTAYLTSIKMAEERGSFPAFDWKTEKGCEFYKRMPTNIVKLMGRLGRRNISLLTNAPTGSVSLMSQTSSGIEPVFRLQYTRRVKTYGNKALSVNFTDQNGDQWHNYSVFHHNFAEYCRTHGHTFDPAVEISKQNIPIPEWFATSDQLDYQKNIKLIAAIQDKIDHGVSCTINLPKGTTLDTVRQLYIQAWQLGLKGVTVYVDGSRSGVLVTEEKKPQIKRPQDLPCEIHITSCQGKRWLVIVGLADGKPYEVFAGQASDLPMPRNITTAITRKMKSRQYSIVYQEDGEEVFVPIKESFVEDNGMLVRLLMNQSLRQGVKVEHIIETVNKATDITNFSRVVTRVLKQYVTDTSLMKCESCKSHDVIMKDGCISCLACAASRCM